MNEGLKKFITVMVILIFILLIFAGILMVIYLIMPMYVYIFAIRLWIGLLLLVSIFFIVALLNVIYIYRKGNIKTKLTKVIYLSIKLVRFFAIIIADIFRLNDENLKKFFIDMNNILVNSYQIKFKAADVLVILPHCLQNFDCSFKVTGDIGRCKRCGKCSISEILAICSERKVHVEVVTGGTAARNIVKKYRSKIIVAVACERDLLSGIVDVGRMPVIGIINQRPNGPCFNTAVDVRTLKDNLNKILK